MRHRLALVLVALGLAACARESSAPPVSSASPPATTAPASTPADATPAAAPASAPATPGDLTAAATTGQESVDRNAASDSGSTSLEQVASLPSQAQLPAGRWVAGKNYLVLSPAQPTDAAPGKVQVIEVFWYGCPHCYALDPFLQSWLQSKPGYVDFVRVPIMWAPIYQATARLFYTLQALGKLDELHTQVFDEIHQRNDPLYVQGDANATLAEQVKFATAHGISASDYTNAYNSFGVQSQLQKADELDRRYRVDSVPTIVINGKYVTDVGRAGGEQQLIQLINDLTASEKRPAG
jgi:protein dithiol oxidoreductase (disulfide-forming)